MFVPLHILWCKSKKGVSPLQQPPLPAADYGDLVSWQFFEFSILPWSRIPSDSCDAISEQKGCNSPAFAWQNPKSGQGNLKLRQKTAPTRQRLAVFQCPHLPRGGGNVVLGVWRRCVTNGCFRKWWVFHPNHPFLLGFSILGYPYFWKHPFATFGSLHLRLQQSHELCPKVLCWSVQPPAFFQGTQPPNDSVEA